MDSPLSQYKIFYTVASLGNISKASRELFISQPAISKAIQKLEQSLDTVLFYRSSRGVRLTEEGALLYEHVKNAFDTLAAGEEKLRNFRSIGMGHLKIGASTTLSRYVLLPCLRNFIADYPNIHISIECQSSSYTRRLLEEGKIDVGLMGTPPRDSSFAFHPLGNVNDIFVASPSYLEHLKLRAALEHKPLYQCAALMLLDQTNLSRQYIDRYITQEQIQFQNLLEVASMDLLIEFAKIGLGIACVIRQFVEEELRTGKLLEIPFASPLPARQIGLAIRHLPSALDTHTLLTYFQHSPLSSAFFDPAFPG